MAKKYYFKTSYGYTGRLNIPYGTIFHKHYYCDDCNSKAEVKKKYSCNSEKIVKIFTGKVFDKSGWSAHDGHIDEYKKKQSKIY